MSRILDVFRRKNRQGYRPRHACLGVEQLEERTLLNISFNPFLVPSSAVEGEAVPIYAQATGGVGPLTYSWDFGDGTGTSGVDLTVTSHVYNPNNPADTPYNVRLTVSDGVSSVSQSGTLLINNLSPTADAGASQQAYQGQAVTFSGQANDPGPSGDITAIEWDFDYRGSFTANASGSLTPTHVYNEPGFYVAALRVTDRVGASTLSLTGVEVRPTGALIVNAGPDVAAVVGTPVAFSGSYSGGGVVTSSDIAWDVNYDGTFDPTITGTLTPTHTFTSPGTYRVALRVTDDFGGTRTDEVTVTARYTGPTAIAGTDRTVTAGDIVSFSGSYADPDGVVSPGGIAWDFDFDLDSGTFTADLSGTLTPTWQFTTPGTYTVALQVTDNHGISDLNFLHVTVNEAPPYVSVGPDRSIGAGDTITFVGFARMSGPVSPEGIEWDFNYNGVSFNPDPSGTGNWTPSPQFGTPGTYTVALRVTDSGSVSVLDAAVITVMNARPVVEGQETLAITQSQTANFSATVSCADPVTIAWDFHYEDGTFTPDPSANGLLNPIHLYQAAGNFLAAIRATNTVSGLSRLWTVAVQVNNVPPTAVVTHSGPVTEGSTVTFTVSGVTDVNPTASFDYAADWTGSGTFEVIPEDRRTVDPVTGAVSFSRAFDDNGTYAVTIRVTDGEGDYTDYVQNLTVTNVAPTVALHTVGGELAVVGVGVPIRLDITEASYADQAGGFTYFFSVNGDPFIQSTSGDFLLPDYTPGAYTVRGYAQDKDGSTSPVAETIVRVVEVTVSLENIGTGTVCLNWSGAAGPVTLSPNQLYDFGGVVTGLTVTLLTPGANYTLLTNGSIDVVNFDSGVAGVTLTVNAGWQTAKSPVGDGHVGVIYLPGGDAVVGSSRLTLSARGALGSIVGPVGSGKLWAEADRLLFDDLSGSITGLDHIREISARWLGDSIDDQVWANYGIDELSVYGIGAGVVSDRLQEDFSPSEPGSTVSVGRGGASGSLELGKVQLFYTAGAIDNLKIGQLNGDVVMENFSSVSQLYLSKTDGATQIRGDQGKIDQLVMDDSAADPQPTIQYFPLAAALVVSTTPSANLFWNNFNRQWGDQDWYRLLRGWYHVHHTHFREFEEIYRARGININDVQYLRAMHPRVHEEINQVVRMWIDEEMKQINRNWSVHNHEHAAAFLRRVRNSNAFFDRLTEFENALERTYARYWIRADDPPRRIREVFNRMDGERNLSRFVLGEGGRMGRVITNLGAALAIFGVIGDGIAFAENVAGHSPQAERAWGILQSRYRAALNRAIQTRGVPGTLQYLMPLKDALIDYLRAIETPSTAVNAISYTLEVYMANLPQR